MAPLGIYETCAGSTIDILLSHRLRQTKKQGFKDQAEVSDVAKSGVAHKSRTVNHCRDELDLPEREGEGVDRLCGSCTSKSARMDWKGVGRVRETRCPPSTQVSRYHSERGTLHPHVRRGSDNVDINVPIVNHELGALG